MVEDMKKVNKGAKRRLLLLFSIFVLLVGYMSYSTITYWKQILQNKKAHQMDFSK